MTDEDRSVAITTELHPTILRTAHLAWRCAGPAAIEAFIDADEFLNSGHPVTVQWRFDQQRPSEQAAWGVSTDGGGAFVPATHLAQFTVGAKRANRVLLRVADYRDVTYDLTFSLAGVSAALSSLGCHGAVDAFEAERATIADATLIANPNTKTYFPLAKSCWRGLLNQERAIYFKTVEEAKAEGYSPSAACR